MHALDREENFTVFHTQPTSSRGRAKSRGAFYGSELILFRSSPSVILCPEEGPREQKKENMPVLQDEIEIKGPWMWARVCVCTRVCVLPRRQAHWRKDSGGKECLQRFGLQRKKKSKQAEIRNYNTITQNVIQQTFIEQSTMLNWRQRRYSSFLIELTI